MPQIVTIPESRATALARTWFAIVWVGSRHSQAASSMGVERMTLNRWLRGESEPRPESQAQMQRDINATIELPPDEFEAHVANRARIAIEWLRPDAIVPGEKIKDEDDGE